jgi:iron complex transport system substrate-binding protein
MDKEAFWDCEKILDVDPEILVFQYGLSHASTEEFEDRRGQMREDPIGQQLTAVENDQLYRGPHQRRRLTMGDDFSR